MEADEVMERIGKMMGDYIEADGIAIVAIQGVKGVSAWSGVTEGPHRAAMMRRLITHLRELANELEGELGPSVLS